MSLCPFCSHFPPCEASVNFAGLWMCEGCKELAVKEELLEDDSNADTETRILHSER